MGKTCLVKNGYEEFDHSGTSVKVELYPIVDQSVCLNWAKKDQSCAIALMNRK